jgi:hypothetical protein
MDLKEVCKKMNLPSPMDIVGKRFLFLSNSRRSQMYGIVSGLTTHEKGLPLLQVSNTKFHSLKISGILLEGPEGGKPSGTQLATIYFDEARLSYPHEEGFITFESQMLAGETKRTQE